MGQTAISCTDRKLPGSLPELWLTNVNGFRIVYHCHLAVGNNGQRIEINGSLPRYAYRVSHLARNNQCATGER
jgi:hypothetical protein